MINFKAFTDSDYARYFGYNGNMEGGYGLYLPVHYQVNPVYWTGGVENDSWFARAKRLVDSQALRNLRTLELGCAFGSLVRALRHYGVDAYGLDVAWPIQVALGDLPRPAGYPPEAVWPEMRPYLIVADALTYLKGQKRNAWDVVISVGFLECFDDTDLSALITEMNRVARFQVHVVDPTVDPQFYNCKPLASWKALPFKAGTVILDGC